MAPPMEIREAFSERPVSRDGNCLHACDLKPEKAVGHEKAQKGTKETKLCARGDSHRIGAILPTLPLCALCAFLWPSMSVFRLKDVR